MTKPTRICYAIVDGEYSDYKVIAVFTTAPLAENELPRYASGYNDPRIEEFPLDPVVPSAPAGMRGYRCSSEVQGLIWASQYSDAQMSNRTIGVVDNSGLGYKVNVWARDKDHAIKIASEKFTHQKAIDLGIAL